MSDEIKQAVAELFGSNTKVGASANTKHLLESAEALGFVRRTGAMVKQPAINVSEFVMFGVPLKAEFALYDQYEII